ncbi:MAG: hypothetical protein D8M57_02865 [Candidatus Scalindua sp. AMX11]|nr:MAG: hypothetical protein DWQ00_17125 [Candidatus Scalindua sp.]TDE66367.1 MAG: hypothetical protein D8M57_02865 [Candidatus Scalindua sp. AMX11]
MPKTKKKDTRENIFLLLPISLFNKALSECKFEILNFCSMTCVDEENIYDMFFHLVRKNFLGHPLFFGENAKC